MLDPYFSEDPKPCQESVHTNIGGYTCIYMCMCISLTHIYNVHVHVAGVGIKQACKGKTYISCAVPMYMYTNNLRHYNTHNYYIIMNIVFYQEQCMYTHVRNV